MRWRKRLINERKTKKRKKNTKRTKRKSGTEKPT